MPSKALPVLQLLLVLTNGRSWNITGEPQGNVIRIFIIPDPSLECGFRMAASLGLKKSQVDYEVDLFA